MSDVPLDQRERLELCDLFDELGPEAPTLNEGWTTAHLAAHLVIRERDPRATLGILAPNSRFGRKNDELMERELERGFPAVVQRVRSGPPLVPWRIPKLRTLLNLNEYVVHHEDVRRANGMHPRTDRVDLDEAIWAMLRRGAKLLTRSVKGTGLVLRRADGEEVQARKGEPAVVLAGEPVELLLYLMGRKGAARVELFGDSDAIDTVHRANFGI